MNLLDYLPAHVIEIARRIGRDELISVYPPEDTNDFRMLVRCDPGLERALSLLSGTPPDAPDLLTLHALSEVIRGGAKVIRPSVDLCRELAEVELNIHLRDYAQPFNGMGVILPGALFDEPKDRLAVCWWRPGFGIHVGLYLGAVLLFRTIGPHWPGTLEETLGVTGECSGFRLTDGGRTIIHRAARICINLGLFAMERRVLVRPLEPRAEKRRRRARCDERFAELAARDAQEVVIQDLDLRLFQTPSSQDGPAMTGGWRQAMHRRRGHWKMQPCGPGRSERRRIYVPSYLVNAGGDRPPEVTTVLS